MSNEPTDIAVADESNLDDFAVTFFGQDETPDGPASPEESEVDEVEDNDAPTDKGTQEETEDDDALETDETDEDEGDDEEVDNEPAPKPKKNRAEERIAELNGKWRETERKLNEALAKLEAKNEKPEPAPEKATENTGPTPDDVTEDGDAKYPLGEFDPKYIADLTRHTLREERERMKQEEEAEIQREVEEEARLELKESWDNKLGPAKERYPDFTEKGNTLIDTLGDLEPAYSEYLSATLMSMDFGPDVLYYLANNIDEAQKIVDLGPTKATVALGRLEAKFAFADEEKQKARPKVSKAPPPPEHLNKGSAASMPEVEDDTDDLDAFAKKLFKRGK